MRIRRIKKHRPCDGIALVVVLVMVSLLVVLVAINADTVRRTFREIKRVEAQQLKRMSGLTNQLPASTNQPPR